jgi:hypothetical protein
MRLLSVVFGFSTDLSTTQLSMAAHENVLVICRCSVQPWKSGLDICTLSFYPVLKGTFVVRPYSKPLAGLCFGFLVYELLDERHLKTSNTELRLLNTSQEQLTSYLLY